MSSSHSCRHMLVLAAVIQLRLKLTHLLLFNLYSTLFHQNIMFQAATALLLCIVRVLGIILNTTRCFLIGCTKRGLGASRQLCMGGAGARCWRSLLCSPGFMWCFCWYLIFLFMAKTLEVTWLPGTAKPVFSPGRLRSQVVGSRGSGKPVVLQL